MCINLMKKDGERNRTLNNNNNNKKLPLDIKKICISYDLPGCVVCIFLRKRKKKLQARKFSGSEEDLQDVQSRKIWNK